MDNEYASEDCLLLLLSNIAFPSMTFLIDRVGSGWGGGRGYNLGCPVGLVGGPHDPKPIAASQYSSLLVGWSSFSPFLFLSFLSVDNGVGWS